MRKLVFVMVAMFLLFSCNKDEEDYNIKEDVMVPVRLEVPLDKTRSDFSDFFPSGKINWGNANNVEYVYFAVPNAFDYYDMSIKQAFSLGVLFPMKAEVSGKEDKLVFEGEIYASTIIQKDNCMVYYFGSNGNSTTKNVTDTYNEVLEKKLVAKKVTFDKQTGSMDELGDYHMAKASVKVRMNKDANGNVASYDLTIGSFTTLTSIAMLDLEGVTKLEGSAAKLKSYTLEWVEGTGFCEKYEYDSLGYIDVSNNVGKKSLIALLPTKKDVALECSKGRYDFVGGIMQNKFYLGKNGNSIEEAMPLTWKKP